MNLVGFKARRSRFSKDGPLLAFDHWIGSPANDSPAKHCNQLALRRITRLRLPERQTKNINGVGISIADPASVAYLSLSSVGNPINTNHVFSNCPVKVDQKCRQTRDAPPSIFDINKLYSNAIRRVSGSLDRRPLHGLATQ